MSLIESGRIIDDDLVWIEWCQEDEANNFSIFIPMSKPCALDAFIVH